MLQRYKEVFYGLLFGLGASVIDVFMHASMEQQGFWMELIHPQPIMVAYRVFFIAFGLALGGLLWRKKWPSPSYSHQTSAIADSRRLPSSTRSGRDSPVRPRKVAGDRGTGGGKIPAVK